MGIIIKKTTQFDNAANKLAETIISQLDLGNNVLWFATGGSSISAAVEASKLIASHPHQNLAVMLTDERYGPVDHANSNWHQLMQKGFNLPQARLMPILTGDSREITTEKFNEALDRELHQADFKIGLFGVGADGHTAGILPKSRAINSQNLAYSYDTENFERITMTPAAILMLDEAVVFTEGEAKRQIVEDLKNKDIDISQQPAQILKRVPVLTIFTNYEK
ncbi:MAG TPA: 6-phosphogluconolactonase [Candidatus Paceibacterota bacterium]|jgi:6-phosphogluconolactonase/glucosamine-6-phosphate isomerase/deaminase|nr:6-phosphogluconolactonase [Candidatus Paceibacterota bacterium]